MVFQASLDIQVIRADFLSEESEKASKRDGILLRLQKVGEMWINRDKRQNF